MRAGNFKEWCNEIPFIGPFLFTTDIIVVFVANGRWNPTNWILIIFWQTPTWRRLQVGWTQFWQFVSVFIGQIMARERLQLTSWNSASEKYTDERFWLTGKICRFRSFHGNMNTTLKFHFLSLHKICSLDFPINLHTVYYSYHYHLKLIWPNFNTQVFR